MHHSHSYNSFSVAGMSSSTTSHHNANPSLNTWGNHPAPLGGASLGELSTSRSNYQSGYLMSASQANPSPQGANTHTQRADDRDLPIVKTKAKMNHASMLRGSVGDFGMDSMFESSRQRQTLADEDAPPTMSVNDIPTEVPYQSTSRPFQPRSSTSGAKSPSHLRSQSQSQSQPYLYIIVFGYPSDKYSLTLDYFKSMSSSETTDGDPNTEITNCFRLGYKDAGDAMRAVRKNGEVLGGSWMVGVKWADAAQAEALLGQSISRSNLPYHSPHLSNALPSTDSNDNAHAMEVDSSPQYGSSTPTVGTPIKLAPSASVFRKQGGEKPATPAPQLWAGKATTSANSLTSTPSKGMIGQVSDLIFGW